MLLLTATTLVLLNDGKDARVFLNGESYFVSRSL